MKIQIKCRFHDKVLFEGEYESTKHAVIDAVSKRADLRSANLRSADLRGADLRGADLRGADLSCADLRGADLRGADLRGADLSGTDLRGADLRGADLRGEKLIIAPIIMQLSRWNVLITHGYMSIGCERHTHEDWASFDRAIISQMDNKAWDWWTEYRAMLMLACELHRKQAEKEQKDD